MPTIETRLRRELRKCAVELRKLAYALPNGVGEHQLLRLSERMSAAAGDAHQLAHSGFRAGHRQQATVSSKPNVCPA